MYIHNAKIIHVCIKVIYMYVHLHTFNITGWLWFSGIPDSYMVILGCIIAKINRDSCRQVGIISVSHHSLIDRLSVTLLALLPCNSATQLLDIYA